jgi:hypothetical protein
MCYSWYMALNVVLDAPFDNVGRKGILEKVGEAGSTKRWEDCPLNSHSRWGYTTVILYIYNNLSTSKKRYCSVDVVFRYTINNTIIILLSSFWKNKRRLIRSPCCLCVCAIICVCSFVCETHLYFVRRFMTAPYCLCVCDPPPAKFLLFLCDPYRIKEAD